MEEEERWIDRGCSGESGEGGLGEGAEWEREHTCRCPRPQRLASASRWDKSSDPAT